MEHIDFHILQWFFGSTPILGLTLMMFLISSFGKRKTISTIILVVTTVLWFIWKSLPNDIWHHMGAADNVGLYQHLSLALVLGFVTSSILNSFRKTRNA
ncbi:MULTISPECIES: hypothetical protein [unclassified Bacillus (in: firmicutes)]|uniref:hypothetical protein n=1 Tax=Bacillaceae TaxID=186817 RepID=UPI000BEF9207|nr:MULTISPECIES: hypothetical protein [unclassified Bacillus (in: firmicutes)]PEJ59183.1 hypothetical protein CN692_06810 [Bacillus sp. AFS002410]PEL14401.1 hypothetical protein CN601_00565 [Bacillus sp. AFS017336]QKE72397.1 hypothetical protein HPK19_06090 [Arthrobacter citreus]